MRKFHPVARALAGPVAAAMFVSSINIGVANAGLIATDTVAQQQQQQQMAADRAQVDRFLARDDVREQMAAMGVDPDEAAMRVAALSDAEIAQIAQRLDQEPAGEGVLETIVVAGLIVFLVLLITDVAGVTNVFSFTR